MITYVCITVQVCDCYALEEDSDQDENGNLKSDKVNDEHTKMYLLRVNDEDIGNGFLSSLVEGSSV
jgi:hypothetical protein